MSKQFSVSKRLLASGALVLIGIGGGFGLNAVVAGGTPAPVTYYGCVIGSSGTISDVTTTGTPPTCPPNSTPISWSSQGSAGTNGTNGSSVVTSSGVPSGSCTTGNTDVDLANGEVYTCTTSAWVDTGKSIKGPAGSNGTNGTNGTSIMTSSAAPTGSCSTGNTDVDLANGEVYTCTASAWVDTGNSIKGPAGNSGTPGTNGTSVVTSSGAPTGSCSTGNTDVDLANGEVYTCTASAWVDTGNSIKGPAGTNGTSVVTSSGAPTGSCSTGNTDVDLANGEVYTCTASAWVDTGNSIKGPAGTNGLSAYQLAEQNGFSGTLAQWLESLAGTSGLENAFQATLNNETIGGPGTTGFTGWSTVTGCSGCSIGFNQVTGTFTVPQTGEYLISASATGETVASVSADFGAGIVPQLVLQKTAPSVTEAEGDFPILDVNVALLLDLRVPLGVSTAQITDLVNLNAGDVLQLQYNADGDNLSYNFSANWFIAQIPT